MRRSINWKTRWNFCLKFRLRRPHFKSLNFGFVPTPAQRDCPSIPPGDEPATNPEVPNSTSTNTRKVRHEQRPSGNSSSEPPRTIRTLAPLSTIKERAGELRTLLNLDSEGSERWN